MFVTRDGALVCPKPGLSANTKVHCRVTSWGHVADQLHLAFPTTIQCLLHPIVESRDKLQGAGIQGSLGHIDGGRNPGMPPKEKK
jgi:hypothetical protein